MRLKIAFATVLVATAVAAVTASSMAVSRPVAGTSAIRTITVKDNVFDPQSITVSRGTTLRFVWRGKLLHNVYNGSTRLISSRKSGTAAVRVNSSVTLRCTLHSTTRSGQRLFVKVR